MKHFGDITKIDGHKVPLVDIICGGSPCQDLSVAGKRQGLRHSELGDEETTRSGLFMEQIRIIKEMHDECRRTNKPIRPRFMVWENVAGVFSLNDGETFRTVLEETARVVDKNASIPRPPDGLGWSSSGCILADGWSISWALHSAEHWGVPQRRARVSLVADFRGPSAPEILFERESVSGDIEPSKKAREGTPENIGGCSDTISFQERAGKDGGVKEYSSKETEQEPSHPQTCRQSSQADNDFPTVVLEGNGSRPSHHGDGFVESDVCYTLNTAEVHGVAFSQDAYDKYTETDVSAALKQSGGNYGGGTETIVKQ